MTLSGHETALCIAALEYAARDLAEGAAIAGRLGVTVDIEPITKSIREMTDLRTRLLAAVE